MTATAMKALVAKRVRDARRIRGLSQHDLAEVSRVGKSTIGQIEIGRQVPNIYTLWRLARALDVTISELIEERP